MTKHTEFMQMAIGLANENIKTGGGPFGAVVVRNDEVIGTGANQVTNYNDPTAHAEVLAIRDACKNLNSFDLSDCLLYTSCEPCPMCLGAIYWARIPKIYYGNNRNDAADIGFDDDFIYKEIGIPPEERSVLMQPLLRDKAIETFQTWQKMPAKKEY